MTGMTTDFTKYQHNVLYLCIVESGLTLQRFGTMDSSKHEQATCIGEVAYLRATGSVFKFWGVQVSALVSSCSSALLLVFVHL